MYNPYKNTYFQPELRELILVVNDEPDRLAALTSGLQALQIPILTTTSGVEALELFLTKRPGLVVLDLELPDLDGIEVLRQMQEYREWKDHAIVVTAPHEGHRDELRADMLGRLMCLREDTEAMRCLPFWVARIFENAIPRSSFEEQRVQDEL